MCVFHAWAAMFTVSRCWRLQETGCVILPNHWSILSQLPFVAPTQQDRPELDTQRSPNMAKRPVLSLSAWDKTRWEKTFLVHEWGQRGWLCLSTKADWTLGGFKSTKYRKWCSCQEQDGRFGVYVCFNQSTRGQNMPEHCKKLSLLV